MSDSKLFQYATEYANKAVAYDKKGEKQQAINNYQKAAGILLQFIKYNKNQSKIRKENKEKKQIK